MIYFYMGKYLIFGCKQFPIDFSHICDWSSGRPSFGTVLRRSVCILTKHNTSPAASYSHFPYTTRLFPKEGLPPAPDSTKKTAQSIASLQRTYALLNDYWFTCLQRTDDPIDYLHMPAVMQQVVYQLGIVHWNVRLHYSNGNRTLSWNKSTSTNLESPRLHIEWIIENFTKSISSIKLCLNRTERESSRYFCQLGKQLFCNWQYL